MGNPQFTIRNYFILLLLFFASCFQPEPLLPPHEALARTAQRIQQIIDEERKVPTEPIQFPQESPANPNEVVFWFCAHPLISHAILAHPERVEAFQSAHPGLKLNHQFIGDWSVAIQKLTVSLAAGEVPDVALVKRPWLARLIDSGWVAPLDDLLPPILLDDFRPVARAPLERNGHLYALPADGFCNVLYYDKSKIATHGETTPPTTWDELRKCARAMTIPNTDPRKTIYGLGDLPFLETLWSAGGEVCNATKCLLDSNAAGEALDFIVSLRTDGLVHPRATGDPVSALDLFLAGRVAMTVASTEYLSYTHNVKFPIGLASVPGKSGPISQQSDNVLVVFAQHANAKRAAITAALDFLTGPAIQDRDAFQNGSTPTRNSLATDAPIPEGIETAFDNSRNTPLIPPWAAIAYELMRCSAR